MIYDEPEEEFAYKLCSGAKNYYDWLDIVRFGLKNLEKHKPLLMLIIYQEAVRKAESQMPHRKRELDKQLCVTREFMDICSELGLSLLEPTK